jgi:hypothetical protein
LFDLLQLGSDEEEWDILQLAVSNCLSVSDIKPGKCKMLFLIAR